jgi:hypothetical protein
MNGRIALLFDVANRTQVRSTQEWFGRSDPTVLMTILSVVGVIASGLLIAALWQKIQDWGIEPRQRAPMKLLRKLERGLGVSWRDRWSLWRIARCLNLPHPAALLISERYFDQCIEKLRASGGWAAPSHQRCRAIRGHLFKP